LPTSIPVTISKSYFCSEKYTDRSSKQMKKHLIAFIMMVLVVGLMPLVLPTSAEAQRKVYARRVVDRNGHVRYVRSSKPSFYRRHRNRVNVGCRNRRRRYPRRFDRRQKRRVNRRRGGRGRLGALHI
jgi:hypothetical protein